ncbi:Phasin protein [Roseovarius tolerans]|uniref:Phasin protein n=1 Tax=Roseovarius tolerans TaxID=74031 RepID=A0A1H7ZI81_9RHOB|nr:phasin family protein [Roseovarius tolerans]SEM58015.1 Phasin protein [Roseovarius tolerans]
MTKSAKKTTAKPDTTALTSAMAAGNPAARMWLDIMAESTRFVSERLQNDLETQRAMLRCQSPADLVQVQSDFIRKAVEQYTSEAQRMYQIMTQVTGDAVKDTKTGTKRGYDDIPV